MKGFWRNYERNRKPCPRDCLWYEQCGNMNKCADYTPLKENDDLADKELEYRKTTFRKEYFEYAKENELYDED